jgi:hypothetical protein
MAVTINDGHYHQTLTQSKLPLVSLLIIGEELQQPRVVGLAERVQLGKIHLKTLLFSALLHSISSRRRSLTTLTFVEV